MKNKLYQKIFLILFLTMGFFVLAGEARADYYAQGILASKNILSNATVTAINSFQITATVPANTTVSVKFSQDRVNYYNSLGVKDGWDSCANGTTNIDLSALGWSQEVLFYKIKLTTTDELVTPVVGQITVDYDGTAVPALNGDTYYQEGIVESKNILSGATVTAVNSFQVTADVPLGTAVKVKFSQDGVNYYSSSGVKDEWDSCVDGTTNINLSGLNWTEASLFYKIKFESKVDEAMTAKVTDTQIDYDGTAVPPLTGVTYPSTGHLVSTDLLAGSGITLSGSDYFGYGISYLPYGSNVYAQFSQDGITWYDSAGTIWGWDTLSFGGHTTPETALSLSALNWRGAISFYYKLKIETIVDNAVTPIITDAGLAMFSAIGGNSGTLLGDPILDLNFNEGQGPTAFDASGNGNNGTLTPGAGGTNLTTTAMWDKGGKKGGAMEFDGIDDIVAISNFQFPISNQFSMSQYLNLKTLDTDEPLVGEWGGSQNNILLKLDNTNNDELRICIASTLTDACTIYGATTDLNLITNQWRSVQVIYDGTESANADKLKLYVDGQKKTLTFTGTIPATIQSASTAGLSIGGNSGDYTNFLMDELKIFSYALSEDEIKTLYNDSSAMSMGNDESRNNNGTAVTGANKDYCIPGDTAKCDKPVLELKMDEMTGATTNDTSGNGNNGTITGATWDPIGKNGSALKFDGSDDHVTLSNDTLIEGKTAMTVSAWVKSNISSKAVGGNFIVSDWDASTFYLDWNQGEDISFTVYDDSGNPHSGIYTDGILDTDWHYIEGVYNGAEVRVYVDNILGGTISSFSEPIRTIASSLRVSNSLSAWNGLIDDVKIYDYARTPAQIAWDYNRGKEINHWKFDEGTGATVHDEGSNLNNGTITGATWKNESECKSGKCLGFDGNDYVSIASAITGINYVSLWIKPDSTTQSIVDFDGGTHKISISSGAVTATGFNSYYVDGLINGTINNTDWHHISAKADTAFNISAGFTYGKIDTSYYSGKIDDPKIYNYPLTAEQIKLDYNGGAVSFE